MNVINIDIDFEKGICEKSGISVVTGDFNSTKLVFNFVQEYEGTKIFELRHINSEIPTYVGEIINNEVVLVGTEEEEGQTTIYSLFDQTGDYVFEVSLYQNDSKLTSMFGYITARQEQVVIGDEIVEPYMPIFDTLILGINEKLDEMDSAIQSVANLDVDAEKIEDITTVTITRQDGTQKSVNVEDGLDGVSLENMEIINKDLYVTYGGNTNNLGQVAPNIQIGTTTTVLPSSSARVINVGTDLNPILNFEIPKGDAGAIKIRIVNVLPQTGDEDTFYLVPKQESEMQNMYDEYVWINNSWELVGEKQIEVDLSDYYTKQETNNLLNNKVNNSTFETTIQGINTELGNKLEQSDLTNYVRNTDYATSSTGGVIKVNSASLTDINSNGIIIANKETYANYQNASDRAFISKGTLENVITGKDLTTKSYVDSLVGDINSALDEINGEVVGGA